jgi:1A family penicillin-binding protein
MGMTFPDWLYKVADRVRWPLSPQHTLIAGLISFAVGMMLYMNCGVGGCPDVRQLAAYQPGGAPQLIDRHGERFADLAPYERKVVPLDSLPSYTPAAFIAVEDRRFWKHRGVDWRRVFGAALANLRSGGVAQGSSTIPMQLARNVFPKELPGSERTMRRKLQETRVARQIERRFSKEEILEMYLNHIYFGGGAYGIEAAARLYFGKSSMKLKLSESAMLAALPKAPSHYDPRRRAERAKQRRDLVLTLMEQQELVEPREAQLARDAKLVVRTNGTRDRTGVPLGAYFIDVVREQLEEAYGEELYRSRLRIYTTLDPAAQRAAERELEAQLKRLDDRVRDGEGDLQGAVVVMESATGDVLALVGGRDPTTSRYNRATLARRQIGSAFKPFVYATALSEGVPTSSLIMDEPLRMQLSRNDVWEPENYDGTYEGPVSLRHALIRSRNVPTVKLANQVGIEDVARTAQLAGVSAKMDVTPALALGTVAMTPLELATAYTTFSNLGMKTEPRFVVRVESAEGKVLPLDTDMQRQHGTMDRAIAYIVTDILRDAVDYGTGTGVRSAGFWGPVAGKTGTTNNATDAWFVGYTNDVVSTVWIGYDTPSPLGSAATGGGFAAPVFGRVMRQVYSKRTGPTEWPVPEEIIERRVDPFTGLVLADGCMPSGGTVTTELFVQNNLPQTACPYRDWWGEFWDRVGGVFGRDDEAHGGHQRREEEARRQAEQARQREREMEEFMRRRSEELRKRGRGNGRGGGGG